MLVRFLSSETGEIMMFSDTARALLRTAGKATTARGTFTREEMVPAALALRKAYGTPDTPPAEGEAKAEGEEAVSMNRRAWPLIDMLERSAGGDHDANIVWTATADF